PAFIVALAWLYSAAPTVLPAQFWKARALPRESRSAVFQTVIALGVLLLLLVLVLLQPDLGTALVFVFVFFVVSALAGVAPRYLALTALGFALSAVLLWFGRHS